ncbi:Laccase [uncultured archaeon]|nr:Laccase [uncultured archaeon]
MLKYEPAKARRKSRIIHVSNGFIGIVLTAGILFSVLLVNSSVVGVASTGSDAASIGAATSTTMQDQTLNTNALDAHTKHRTTSAERKAAAIRAHKNPASGALVTAPNPGGIPDYFGTTPNYANSPAPTADPVTGTTSGGIRKFVDSLPGVGPDPVPGAILFGKNNLGQYIPLAQADNTTYPGSDYYEIGLVQYTEKMHSDLKPTLLRGYVQLSTAKVPGKHVALINPDGTPVLNAAGGQVYAVDNPHYLGPLIYSHTDRPVRVKFTNFLPTGAGGDLFLPVDTTIMGAGVGPKVTDPSINDNGTYCGTNLTSPNTPANCYAQNRVTIHLHGGNTPWISDGSQDMWTTPAGEKTQYPKGVSTKNVPDMDNGIEPAGTMTFYYTNQQSARLMFYHDHAYGITRLNVYAGIAAPYIVDDNVEAGLESNGIIPAVRDEAPLVIQDKTYLPDASTLAAEDPTWPFALNTSRSDLWFPHVYMPNQNFPADATNAALDVNPMGRWDYGPWMFPSVPAVVNYTSFPNPRFATNPCGNPPVAPCEYQFNHGTPLPSVVPEAFVDTTVINGNAYPYLNVGRNAYEFEVLDAANDRGYNLQLYYASTAGPFVKFTGGGGSGASAALTVDATGSITGYTITSGGAGYTSAPDVAVFDARGHIPAGSGAVITAGVDLNASNVTYGTVVNMMIVNGGSSYSVPTLCIGNAVSNPGLCTEVRMVPAVPGAAAFPADNTNPNGDWTATTGNAANPYAILDGRIGGVPDPAAIPPTNMIQIKSEGGILPAPVVIPNRPVGFDYNNSVPGVLNVREKALFMDPAERAEVIVDFSRIPDGSTLILYSDAPIPITGADPRYDYFTDGPDNTLIGGAPSTIPGYGPNIRTLMQFRVNAAVGGGLASFSMTNLTNAQPQAYAQSQDKPIVPESAYNAAFHTGNGNTYVGFPDTSITINGTMLGMKPKSINDAFDPMYGGLYTTLGVALPATPCTYSTSPNVSDACPIPYNHWDPPTEVYKNGNAAAQIGSLADGTQIWRVYSNSVDTHPMHWHMFNVQVINRIGQLDGAIKPPDPNELGWRETLRMNPLEDTVVAIRPIKPDLPWDLPNNIRPLDVTAPLGTKMQFQNIDPSGQTANVTNHLVNFGEEFVWHCHILGHEEIMIMRPMSLVVTPNAPSNLKAQRTDKTVIKLTWTDNSTDETDWTIQRKTGASDWATIATVPSTTGPTKGTKVRYTDNTGASDTTYYYRILATNIVGDTTVYAPGVGYPNMAADSAPSNTDTATTK